MTTAVDRRVAGQDEVGAAGSGSWWGGRLAEVWLSEEDVVAYLAEDLPQGGSAAAGRERQPAGGGDVREVGEACCWGGRLAEVWLAEEDVAAYLAEPPDDEGGPSGGPEGAGGPQGAGAPVAGDAADAGALASAHVATDADEARADHADTSRTGAGRADAGRADAGGTGDPVVLVGEALGVLGRLNDWLAGMAAGTASGVTSDGSSGTIEPWTVRRAMEGLAGIDAALSAARLRGIVAADVAGLPSSDGAVSLSAWVAGVFGLSGATAAREVRLAVGLADEAEVLDRLQAGVISRDHAAGLVAAAEKQAADQDAAARAEAARQDAERQERRLADERAQAEAATLAERMRLAREAAAREEQLARERAEAARERAAADEAARRARQEALLGSAVAGASPDRVRTEANAMRAADVAALERAVAAQRARRSVTFGSDRITGQTVLRVVLTDTDRELLHAGIEAAHTFDPPNTPEDERRTPEQRRYDAFLDLITAGLHAGELPTSRGIKPHVTVTVPLTTLTGEAEVAGVAGFGTVVSPETARRLACDARLTRAIIDARGMPLDIGRTTRAWTTAQHTAANLLFGGCAFPTADRRPCGRPIGWTDLHHVQWWRHGGPTDQDNGVPLCRHHHNAVHHDGWLLDFDLPTGTVTITRTREGETVTRTTRFPDDNPRPSIADPTTSAGPVSTAAELVDGTGQDCSDPDRAGLDRGDPGDGRLPI
ncbi:HNH endonuclease [Euzebya rosea]|uniref:HNH endonuclease n=1 Tax=Euzebya rosea TaxID=2052804 RepID=UPI001473BCCD|nr:HNH endonuclease signature motif containing protein [Euzebya rosea]